MRLRTLLLIVGVALAACASPYRVIERPSPHHDGRVRFLVLHFTDGDFARAMHLFGAGNTERRVSAHYVVSAPGDPDPTPGIYRLVPEARRAWHAGDSRWQGRQNLNDHSIGIEIVYDPKCPHRTDISTSGVPVPGAGDPGAPAATERQDPDAGCDYRAYPDMQIERVRHLAAGILARHPDIDPTRVVGHADIAPGRKSDPGPRFPWRALHEAGIGAWYDEAEVARWLARLAATPRDGARSIRLMQEALAAYGYGIEATGIHDVHSHDVVFAFQTHFLPDNRTAMPDERTTATALALLARYRPEALAAISARQGW